MQRKLLQSNLCIQIAGTFRLIGTRNGSHLITLIGKDGIYIVGAVTLWHIGKLRAYIAHRTFLISHIVYLQIRRNREFFLGLDKVEVSIHDTRDIRHIWNHTQHLVQIEPAHADGDILQGILVLIVGIDTHTHIARCCLQYQIGRNTAVITQHHIVGIIGNKLLITQYRMGIYQGNLHTIRLQHSSESHIHTQLIGCIIEASFDIGTMLLHFTIYHCPEHILRIMRVVLNTG